MVKALLLMPVRGAWFKPPSPPMVLATDQLKAKLTNQNKVTVLAVIHVVGYLSAG